MSFTCQYDNYLSSKKTNNKLLIIAYPLKTSIYFSQSHFALLICFLNRSKRIA